MNRPAALDALQDRLGYKFKDRSALELALTHSSSRPQGGADNQRLEFLGDRVLGIVIAEALLEIDREAPPGVLATRYNVLVSGPTCAEVANCVGLGKYVRLGKPERKSGGARNTGILADTIEAVVAAIFLDGGMAQAKEAVHKLWGPKLESIGKDTDTKDPKNVLQEWAQGQGQRLPRYSVLRKTGTDHSPKFTVQVEVDTGQKEVAQGTSKRRAEFLAAAALLTRIQGQDG